MRRIRTTLTLSETTLNWLREHAGGPHAMGVKIDEVIQKERAGLSDEVRLARRVERLLNQLERR